MTPNPTPPQTDSRPAQKKDGRACAACVKRGKTWNGDDPICSFPDGGEFTSDGWSCATADLIRDLVYEGQPELQPGVCYTYCDDMKYATVRIADSSDMDEQWMCLWVSWYKNRGGTDAMLLIDSHGNTRVPNERDILRIAAMYQNQPPVSS